MLGKLGCFLAVAHEFDQSKGLPFAMVGGDTPAQHLELFFGKFVQLETGFLLRLDEIEGEEGVS